jgi:hypothetical protein
VGVRAVRGGRAVGGGGRRGDDRLVRRTHLRGRGDRHV